MRTLVDLPEGELRQLTELGRARRTSRTQLIRLAVSGFLAENKPGLEDSFGIWKGRNEDGVTYQRRSRDEWQR